VKEFRMRRFATTACVPLLALTLAVGCSKSPAGRGVASANGSAAASATPTLSILEQGRRHAQCMREHGVPEADPQVQPDGGVRLGGGYDKDSVDGTVLSRATEACKQYEPVATGPDDDRKRQGALEYARCMRAHGVENFPDPDANNSFNLPTEMTDPDYDAARAYCRAQERSPGPTGSR
jgi:hypothetical protein